MTSDEMIVEVVSRGLVRVDAACGRVFGTRTPKVGVELGCLNAGGYAVCTLHLGDARCQVKLHRLIWISVNGPVPAGMVPDHINRIRHDNRIDNLRLATHAENAANRRRYTGSENPSAKIDAVTAGLIREGHAGCSSYAKVAAQFGVSKSLVAQIVRGELWAI